MAGNVQRRPDGKWRARYRDANHREHARHFPRKRDAEQWLASQDVAIARGEWVDPTLSKITGRRMAAALAGSANASEADHDGLLRRHSQAADPAALGGCATGPSHALRRVQLGVSTFRRRPCAGIGPLRPSGAVTRPRSGGP